MNDRDDSDDGASPQSSFWRSRNGTIVIGFFAIIGVLLVFEHRAHIFTGNWLLVVLLGACIAMHLFMHGGHRGHGGGHDRGEK